MTGSKTIDMLPLLALLSICSAQVVKKPPISNAMAALHEKLLFHYNRNVRPSKNPLEPVEVGFGASLIRIIRVDEVNQVLTTNLWLQFQWIDHHLVWNPGDYENITKIHLTSDLIWTPDIILYNNAHGDPHVSVITDALVHHDGRVVWKPPAIYNSFCGFDIQFFPFDTQQCQLKFGGWSHHKAYLDMYQIPVVRGVVPITLITRDGKLYQYLEVGMDISYLDISESWDLINLTSRRNEKVYPGCCGDDDIYPDVTFYLTLRRKPLYYTVHMAIPCTLIAILTTFVFYIPATDRHKIHYSISILVTLQWFLLILCDIIPPTSLVMPLIGKYLVFTMFLVAFSIFMSVFTLRVFHRNAATHKMSPWMRYIFIDKLPTLLCGSLGKAPAFVETPEPDWLCQLAEPQRACNPIINVRACNTHSVVRVALEHGLCPSLLQFLINNVIMIAEHFRAQELQEKVSEEWSFVALVIDRVFLILFTLVNIVGTGLFLYESQLLFDFRVPLAKPPITKPLADDSWYNRSFV